ncbi:flavin-containing monooxygenase [Pseudohaliea rubra]|uniref:Monooxygenase, flavin-binding protein family n=1 Tax=Pseudohaliea rubra DSM 19751 TaxID=1265313 RepID=A0A095VMY1_9GAMM|nr:NAD(P)/FAD-dependent oxidoreductase [Pseudohaliea rubra]KGE02725.1 monooxygenase, flavin-binding protein family [Pseudohaliea rubra DSM 19751]
MTTATERVDVVIVGAGLSGIGAAWHLQQHCPEHGYLILEARDAIGGTWDLFRYPGIRSDSDMHTLGYKFRPWRDGKAIADGPAIRSYVRDTAREGGIDSHIRFSQRLLEAHWDSGAAEWRLVIEDGKRGGQRELRAGFLLMCAGYYRYDRGHTPDYPGRDDYRGTFIHPQFWPEELAYAGKRVVVIGSGATAMTLVPALAEKAAEVVMLQRSPTWVISRPARDRLANALRAFLPDTWAYALTRLKNTALQQWFYRRSREAPEKVRRVLLRRLRKALGPGYDVARHFTPSYNPWDQRLCLVPDGDLFEVLRAGRARVVTDTIERLTEGGVRLTSGEELPADIIVSATGLEVEVLGGVRFSVDGEPVDFARTWTYKGIMCSGVPNLVSVFGYINASWTLRADLTAEWACRLLKHLDTNGFAAATPTLPAALATMPARDWIDDFSPGYLARVMHRFPRQGDRAPWVNPQDYRADRALFLEAPIDDDALIFSRADRGADRAA